MSSFRISAKKIAYFIAIFLCVTIVGDIVHTKLFESYTQIKLNKSLIFTNKIYVGLNSEGKGYWNPKNEEFLKQLEQKYGQDTRKIAEQIKDRLITDTKNNKEFSQMLREKIKVVFVSDSYGAELLNSSLKIGSSNLADLEQPRYLSNLYYYFILFFALISTINIIKTQDIKKLYFIIFILGLFGLILIGEAQPSYKLTFIFSFVILASVGLRTTVEYPVKQKIQRFLKEN